MPDCPLMKFLLRGRNEGQVQGDKERKSPEGHNSSFSELLQYNLKWFRACAELPADFVEISRDCV